MTKPFACRRCGRVAMTWDGEATITELVGRVERVFRVYHCGLCGYTRRWRNA